MSIFEWPFKRFKGFWFLQNIWIKCFGSDSLLQQPDECRCCFQIDFPMILGLKILENRDQNLYKNELGSKVAFNFPLGVISATIWSDFGVQIFSLFLFSGVAVCPKLGFRDKVPLGKPPWLIFESLLIVFLSVLVAFTKFCVLFETDKQIVGEIATRPDTHSVGIWVVDLKSLLSCRLCKRAVSQTPSLSWHYDAPSWWTWDYRQWVNKGRRANL